MCGGSVLRRGTVGEFQRWGGGASEVMRGGGGAATGLDGTGIRGGRRPTRAPNRGAPRLARPRERAQVWRRVERRAPTVPPSA